MSGSYKIRVCTECGTAVALGQLNHWHRGDPSNTPFPVEEIEVVPLSKVRERLLSDEATEAWVTRNRPLGVGLDPIMRHRLERSAKDQIEAILAAAFPPAEQGDTPA